MAALSFPDRSGDESKVTMGSRKIAVFGTVISVFFLGVILGWTLYSWRARSLRARRDYYTEKARQIHKKIES